MNQAQKDEKIKNNLVRIGWAKFWIVFFIIMTAASAAAIYFALPYTADIRRVRYLVNEGIKQNIQRVYDDSYIKNNLAAADDLNFSLIKSQTDYPYFSVYDLELKESEDDENELIYECKVTNPTLVALNLTINGTYQNSDKVLDKVKIQGRVKLEKSLLKKKVIVDNDDPLFYLLLCFRNMPADTKTGNGQEQLIYNVLHVAEEYSFALGLSAEEQVELVANMMSDLDTLSIQIESKGSTYIANNSDESKKYILKNLQLEKEHKDYVYFYLSIAASVFFFILIFLARKHKNSCEDDLEECRQIETDAEKTQREAREREAKRIKLEREREERRLEAERERQAKERAELERLEKIKWEQQEKERKKMEEQKAKREERERRIRERQDNEFEYQIYSGKVVLDEEGKEKRDAIFLERLKEAAEDDKAVLDVLIGLVFNPTDNRVIRDYLLDIVTRNSSYRRQDNMEKIKDAETALGWGICAMIRCEIAAGKGIKLNTEHFKLVLDRYNALAEKSSKLYREYLQEKRFREGEYYNLIMSLNKEQQEKTQSVREIHLIEQLNALSEEMKGGLMPYCISEDPGFALDIIFTMIASRKNFEYSRFMMQCIIIGLLPYMMENKDNELVKAKVDDLIEMRSNLINWAENRSFFEVRVYDTCDSYTFANVLKEILVCANPSLNYGDIQKTVRILESELPGVMFLLRQYPLRLIDNSEEKTEGFYKMAPFSHLMWTTFNGEKEVGPVNSRYNQVVDQTLPNSVGINLKLFCDSYSTIPVLFHEFCHYLGNTNEAAVFLLTHKFSEYFYKKYADAAETMFNNYTYVYLKKNLKGKAKDEQIEVINDLIKQLYGGNMPLEEAKKLAAANINNINMQLIQMNRMQRWHPEVSYPLLTKYEDRANAELMYKAIVRYHVADKDIDIEYFDKCESEWELVSEGINDYVIHDRDWSDIDYYLK
ncbi:MAG: hypothetical protein JXN65_02315 [Clostridia bacterium]|nr:hypothetical protein [Clostridia bacterium]